MMENSTNGVSDREYTKNQKQIDIFYSILNTALHIKKIADAMPKRRKKRPFNKIDRRPFVRITKKENAKKTLDGLICIVSKLTASAIQWSII